jgi:uncharacterized protein YndB with AHSA1/START domain
MERGRRLMTWILGAAGVIAGLVLVLALVGAFLPRDHMAQVAIELRTTPDSVWRLTSDFQGTARWRPEVRSIEVQPDSGAGLRFTEVTKQGRTPFAVVSQNPPAEQVVRVVDEGLPFGGTWTWSLAPSASGTRLTITEAGFVRNPIFRVMGRLFFRPTATIESYMRALARALNDPAQPVVLRER